MERVGFIGLGRMGQAMAGHILDAGFPLAVYNRTPARAAELLARGATWADTPAALLDQADLVLTSLTDERAVEQVFLGEQGLLAGDAAGRLLIETSTIRTRTIQQLAPQVAARGARLLDAPVSGTLGPARAGQLLTMVGGAAEDVERAQPVLATFSRRVVHIGPSGAGTTMKLVLNMPMAIFWAGLAEAISFGRQFGLDTAQMLDIYLDSPVALPALRAKLPVLLGEPHEVAFDIAGVRKDMQAMLATAQDAGVPTPAGTAALSLFTDALAAGYGERDLAFVVDYVTELARRTS